MVVTTPEEVSMADVRKELNFCKKTRVPVIGVVANMATFQTKVSSLNFSKQISGEEDEDSTAEVLEKLRKYCPEVLDMVAVAEIFTPSRGGPEAMAEKFSVPYLGSIPLDRNLLKCCENGECFVETYDESPALEALNSLADSIFDALPVG